MGVSRGQADHGRRLGLWISVLALPLAALGLLLAEPDLDLRWEHHPSHFWLVLTVAGVNVALGLVASEVAARRDDDRTFLVSMALLASAGFLGLHALATPGILIDHTTAGFSVAARIGLLLAAGFAAVSALGPDSRVVRVLARHHRPVRRALPPATPAASPGRPGRVRLLAEAMIAVAFSRTWHAMWWEWHVLMAVAFGAILVAARVEYRREGSLTAVFAAIYLDSTLRRIDRHDAERLAEVVDAIRSGRPVDQILARFRQEGMSREEADLLERSARELSRVDELFHLYAAPQLATALERQPERARLGGDEREVSVLFADLAGFTGFAEERPASEVVEMLNRYWAAAVPAVVGEGGLIERFAGDAIIIAFNAVTDQPDHAMRAARAALAIRSDTEPLAAEHASWPRFRIAVNTGPAVVGNVGADLQRSFTVIGDTINLAARLQAAAPLGEVVIGPTTREGLGDRATVVPLGATQLRGRREPVPIYRLVSVTN
jgi:adenylate cyclase